MCDTLDYLKLLSITRANILKRFLNGPTRPDPQRYQIRTPGSHGSSSSNRVLRVLGISLEILQILFVRMIEFVLVVIQVELYKREGIQY
jgi:hypothetical protein